MNHFLLVAEIIGETIVGLIAMAGGIATVRAVVGAVSTAWIPANVKIAEQRADSEGWLHRALVAFDIAFNVVVLRGQQDETISTHSYRASVEGKLWGKAMTKWLDWIQPFHGQKAASGDLERAQVRVNVLSKLLGQ